MPRVNNGESFAFPSDTLEQPLKKDLSGLTDEEFCEAFESLSISKNSFHHCDHIRLAWIYSSRFSKEESVSRMVRGIRAFAKHHGVEAKYHHTITLAWMRLVQYAINATPRARYFSSFANANPDLLNPRLLGVYYSSEALRQDAARTKWIEPDLCPLP